MKIVAILDVDGDKFYDEEHEYSLDDFTEKFIGYYLLPNRDKEAVIATKNNFYCVVGQDKHEFIWGDSF